MKKIVILICFLFAVNLSCDNAATQGIVKYEVTCSTPGFNVTYMNDGGNIEQIKVNSYAWSKVFTANSGSYVSVMAQANSENSDVEVTISYNSKVIQKAKSSGDFVIANATGTLPWISD